MHRDPVRALLLFAAAIIQSACISHASLPKDFYRPAPRQQAKLPYGVVIEAASRDTFVVGTKPSHYQEKSNGCLLAGLELDTYPALLDAIRSELSSAFREVRDGGPADLIVTPGLNDEAIWLSFKEPETHVELVSVREPTRSGGKKACTPGAWVLLGCVPPFYWILPVKAHIEAKRVAQYKAAELTQAIPRLIARLPSDPMLSDYAKARAAVSRAREQGDQARAGGRFAEASNHYREALALVPMPLQGTAFDEPLRERYLQAIGKSGSAPPVPEEAKRHAIRAQALIKRAEQTADYDKAVDEMQIAVTLAPWWVDAYYNLGLIQENAKQYKGAARSLKLYLAGAPSSPEAKAVQSKIYELEVADEQGRASAEDRTEADDARAAGEALGRATGGAAPAGKAGR